MNRPRVSASIWMMKDVRGAATVEFALVSVVFFLVLFGIIEGGRLIYDYNRVSFAARDGARWAAVHGSASDHPKTKGDIQIYVNERSLGLVPPADPANSSDEGIIVKTIMPINYSINDNCADDDVNSNWTEWPENNNPDNLVCVSASAIFSPIVGLVPFGQITLRSTATMLIHR